jgi:quinone-modifying oxidoreductase, subunit QmoA
MVDEQTVNSSAILVVGGGMSGITAAIEAAETGYDVYLIEKNPYLGGRVAQLNQYFPKLCPPNCGLEINFRRMRGNSRIHLFTMAQVESISGVEGNYRVAVKLEPRYVNEKCTACGKCGEACKTEIPNPFNFGMDKIKGAYLPHEFAFPSQYVIAPEVIATDGKECQEACAYGAVELDMQPKTFDLHVGSIIWATGWNPYDAARIEYYGFGRYPNVITNMMVERMAAVNGPTSGKIKRPSDDKELTNVAFIQCSGSRDENHLAYCSGVCCLASLKQATYVREQYPDAKITIYFIDIRARGRFEDFYVKLQQDENLTFIKSKIALITEDEATGELVLEGENTMTGEKIKAKADLVVLATGMVPNTAEFKVPADVKYDEYGFIAAEAGEAGIYGAGCVKEPIDVAACVEDATGAALKAIGSIVRR